MNVGPLNVGPRFLVVALGGAGLIALMTAIPTAVIDNPLFTRMTPVSSAQYFFWVGTSLLGGLLLATYVSGPEIDLAGGGGVGGGLLGYLAVGCPICNKVIVGLLGVTGAMDYFAPIQPALGALGLTTLAAALAYRIRSLRRGSCRVRQPA